MNSPGFQTNFFARTTGVAAETRFVLYRNGEEFKVSELAEADAGDLLFPTIGIPVGTTAISIEVEAPTGTLTCGPVDFVVATGQCSVTLSPLPSDGCETEDDNPAKPGVQMKFVVTNDEGDCDEAYLQYDVGDGAASTPPVALIGGQAEIEIDVSNADQAEATVLVQAIVRNLTNPDATNNTDYFTYTVDTLPPTVTITSPAAGAKLGLQNDTDPLSPGIQIAVVGTVSDVDAFDTASVSIEADNGNQDTVTPGGDGEFSGVISFPDSGAFELTAAVADDCGLTATHVIDIEISTGASVLEITSPTDGATLLAVDDPNPNTPGIFETDFVVSASDLTPDTTLTVLCSADSGDPVFVPVGSATFAAPSDDGTYAVPVELDVTLTGIAQVCRVTDSFDVENPEINPATSADVHITVALPGAWIQLQEPGPGLVTSASTLTLGGSATNLDGRTITVTLTGEFGQINNSYPGKIAAGSFSFDIDLTNSLAAGGSPLADGEYSITIAATDKLGNAACANPASVCHVAFIVDTQSPTLTIYKPEKASLNPDTDPDSDPDAPGYQADVGVTVADGGNEAGSTVCVVVNGAVLDPPCQQVPADSKAVVWSDVTLQPGTNSIVANGKDTAGNVADEVTATPILVSDAPAVSVTKPAADTSTAFDTADVTITVTDSGGTPEAGATAALLVNGALSAVDATNLGNGDYEFKDVPLQAGPNSVVGQATVNGSDGFSSTRVINYKEDVPTVKFTTPEDNQVLSTNSPECGGGGASCKLTVECATTNVDDASEATLTTNCGAGPSTTFGIVVADKVTFPGVQLANNSTCSLQCAAMDKGTGQTPQSPEISVTVDVTAPTFGVFLKPATNVLIFVDDSSPAAGFQYKVQATVSGVEQGQVLTLTASWEGGGLSLQHQLQASIGDDDVETIIFEEATYPQGIVTFKLDGADAAGNQAVPLQKAVEIVSEAALVRISQPAYVADIDCTSDSECTGSQDAMCVAGTCGLGWGNNSNRSIHVVTSGIPALSNNLRICSDNPALGLGGAAKCVNSSAIAGVDHYEVTVVTMSGNVQTVSVSDSLPEGVHSVVAEAKLDEAGAEWESSLNAAAIDRMRWIEVDLGNPTVGGLTAAADANGDDCINASEAAGGVSLEVTCSEDGSVAVEHEGLSLGSQPAIGGEAVSFPVSLLEGDNTLTAVCLDKFKNASAVGALGVEQDQGSPSLAFSQPTADTLLAGANLDVTLLSDALGESVSLLSNLKGAVGTADVQPSGEVLFDHATFDALGVDGDTVLTATVSDACGNSKVAQTDPFVVDVNPPSVVLDAPLDGAQLTDADDASAEGGFQIEVAISTGGDAATWEISLQADCDDAFAGCGAAAVVSSGAVQNPGGAEATVTITLPIFKTPDYLILTLSVSDEAGNVVSAKAALTVTLSECSASLSGLPSGGKVGNALCATPGADCDSVELTFDVQLVGACGAVGSVNLKENGVTQATEPVVDGKAMFTRTYAHDSTVSIEGVGTGGPEDVSTGVASYQFDMKSPQVTFVAATVQGFETPASNTSPSYNLSDDQAPGTPGLQIHLSADVTDDGLGGGELVSLTAGGSVVAAGLPVDITGTSANYELTNIPLPDGAGIEVVLSVVDDVGNMASTSFTYTGDVVPPSALSLSITDANPRRPAATLGWAAVGDNADAGGAAATYDFRYSKLPLNATNFESGCVASNLIGAAALPSPAAPGADEAYTVAGPDPRGPDYAESGQDCFFVMGQEGASYYFAGRVSDAAGNWSELGDSSVVSTTELGLRYAKYSIVGALADDDWDDRARPLGDVNNDGFADFALGGSTTNGVCIFYGSAQETIGDVIFDPTSAPTGPNYQCLIDELEVGEKDTRTGHPAANIGDVNGDGLQDIGIPSGRFSNGQPNEVRIYFGVLGGQLAATPDVLIVGFVEKTLTARFDGGGNFNGDTTDHDNNGATPEVPIHDLVIADRHAEEVYIVPGSASWSTGLTIDLAKPADHAAWNVLTFRMTNNPDTSNFGYAVMFGGNVLTDAGGIQYDEIVVSAANQTADTQAVVLKGRAITGPATFEISYFHDGTRPEDESSVQLLPEPGAKNNFGDTGYAADANGDGIPDIWLAHAKNAEDGKVGLYLYDGGAIRDAEGGSVAVGAGATPVGDEAFIGTNGVVFKGPWTGFGNIGNFNDDPVAGVDASGIGLRPSGKGSALLRFNTDHASAGLPYGTFPWFDVVILDPFDNNNLLFGSGNITGVGDVNGDGLVDIVVGTDGSGYAVLIY